MAKLDKVQYLLLIMRLVLAAVFLLAALPKIQDPVSFAASVEAFRIIEGQWSLWVALILPWMEIVIGLGLLVPQLRRSSGLIIASLLLLFIVLHTSAWIRGLDISCGCFGREMNEQSPNYLWLITRNCFLLVASITIFLRDWRNPWSSRETKPMTAS